MKPANLPNQSSRKLVLPDGTFVLGLRACSQETCSFASADLTIIECPLCGQQCISYYARAKKTGLLWLTLPDYLAEKAKPPAKKCKAPTSTVENG